MQRLVTGDEMKRIDEYTIRELGVPSLVLMERAALAVCKHINSTKRYLAVCGTGNNAGDAIAVARILKSKGVLVDVMLCETDKNKGSEGYKYQLNQAEIFGVNIVDDADFEKYDYVIDGIFGIGLTREIEGKYKDIIDRINYSVCEVIAIDCPSGVDCNTGRVLGTAIQANKTITFGAMKKGLVVYPGAEYSGNVIVEDIGFPEKAYKDLNSVYNYVTDYKDINLLPKRINDSNKGTYGKVVIIAGSKNMAGAAVMASKACYQMGCGLIKVVTCEENRTIIQSLVPEAILTTYENDLSNIDSEIQWGDVVLIGPGLSTSDVAVSLVKKVLECEKRIVMDADALNILSKRPDLKDKIKDKMMVITPHMAEMSRLIDRDIKDVSNNITEVCQDFALQNNIVCVLKDSRTVISNGANYIINISGNNGMAKAGSGDVLAGMIAGILAVKENIYESAILGVYLHGMSGDNVSARKGKYSMSPMDIIEEISNITSQVEANQ